MNYYWIATYFLNKRMNWAICSYEFFVKIKPKNLTFFSKKTYEKNDIFFSLWSFISKMDMNWAIYYHVFFTFPSPKNLTFFSIFLYEKKRWFFTKKNQNSVKKNYTSKKSSTKTPLKKCSKRWGMMSPYLTTLYIKVFADFWLCVFFRINFRFSAKNV